MKRIPEVDAWNGGLQAAAEDATRAKALEKPANGSACGWSMDPCVLKSPVSRGSRPLDFAAIIRDFAHSERVPVAAIQAATAEPEDFVQQAIALLQHIRSSRLASEEEQAMSVLVHVLGEIGDDRVLPPLLDVLSLPRDRVERILGDTITESLPRILMRLGGNGGDSLQQLVENKSADEFVRNAAFDAWSYLVLIGRIARHEARAYLADYPERVNPPRGDYGWVSWVDCVATLGFDDLKEPVAKVFADDNIPRHQLGGAAMTLEDFDWLLEKTLGDPEGWRRGSQFQPFEDTVGELSKWYGYSDEFIRKKYAPQLQMPASFHSAVNEYRDVGRNDPCPCGSGKKFKKCCLQSLH